jgi:isoleucyl-tRNA synthetase
MFTTPGPLDFVAIGREMLELWEREGIFARLVEKNGGGPAFSFLDGPITANNPMGVHHAWGRTYKDLVQRYRAMRGFDQRYQNGFDCQGLWVEVEVEKALGFNGKREIEAFGLDRFARACRERVLHFARVQTEQSRKLGQWMDWSHSYYTMSDANMEHIWHFLAECHARGWIQPGHRVMPWCPRCGTSISQHEMQDAYAELVHESVVVALPILGRPDAYLLAWTTTPWTLPANAALAVHPDLPYEEVAAGGRRYYVAAEARRRFPGLRDVRARLSGAELVGLRYSGPFDELPAQHGIEHRVVAWEAVSPAEGTGIVHIAPGCGEEDFELGRRHGLAAVAPLDESGVYVEGFGGLSGTAVADAAPRVLAALEEKGWLYNRAPHRHRYPTCWRCREELVFRLVDEWFIRADELRPLAIRANAEVNWQPPHMRLRMHDWLSNMADWCISRKRFWGLPLPFYPCGACGRLTVVGSRPELRELAVDPERVDALGELHRPWIDEVLIRCPSCGRAVPRVPEVGDCWLDAGIVPFSTLGYLTDRAHWERWFPAEVVVEMMAQLRGWFYSLLVMSVTLTGRAPYRTVVAHERVLGADRREMHKSWGNAIWFDEAVDGMGPDVIRYLFASQSVAEPVRFGYEAAREVKRKFLTLWNVHGLFVTYANIDRPLLRSGLMPPAGATGLERWLLGRLQVAVGEVRSALDAYQVPRALATLEEFIREDLSNWYVRRRRRQFWKGEVDDDKHLAYATLHHVLVRVSQLLAPVVPFLAERVYRTLVAERQADAPASVHLTEFPVPDPAIEDRELEAGMALVRRVLSVGLAARSSAKLKVRQPLARALVVVPDGMRRWVEEYRGDLTDELNVEALDVVPSVDDKVTHHAAFAPRDPRVHGALVPVLARAVAALPGRDVRDEVLRHGRVVAAAPGREPVEVAGADVRLAVRALEGYAAAADRDVIVVLDTRLTPSLRRKGIARHVVHHVQNLRKRSDLHPEDRIRLTIAAPVGIAEAIGEHREFICAETLAVELTLGEPAGDASTEEAAIEGVPVRLGLTRAVSSTASPGRAGEHDNRSTML